MSSSTKWSQGLFWSQADYLWVKSQANLWLTMLRGVWKNGCIYWFFKILFYRYYLKRFEKMSWKGHGKVIEFHCWISVWTMLVNSPYKGPVTRKMFPFDDVVMQEKTTGTSTPTWSATTSYQPVWIILHVRSVNTYIWLKSLLGWDSGKLWLIETHSVKNL